MGIYDRDYYRTPPPQVGAFQMWTVTTWLIVINVAVYIVNSLIGSIVVDEYGQRYLVHPLFDLGYFSVATALARFQIWRFLTFQFLHGGLTHLLFNMFSLYFFGPLIEAYLGRRRFLAFYLLCGIGGPILYVILWAIGILGSSEYVPLVGASAGIFGVLIAAAQVAPNATVLIYGAIPARLRTLAWILLAVAVFTVFSYGQSGRGNAGGEAAHLGGAAVGFLLIRKPQVLNVFERRPRASLRY
ncbi:MAG: rhomboid family intramembrane serine protease [Tepidisphaeraceae bacterium]